MEGPGGTEALGGSELCLFPGRGRPECQECGGKLGQWYHDLICVLRRSPWLPGGGGEFLGDVWEYFGD